MNNNFEILRTFFELFSDWNCMDWKIVAGAGASEGAGGRVDFMAGELIIQVSFSREHKMSQNKYYNYNY